MPVSITGVHLSYMAMTITNICSFFVFTRWLISQNLSPMQRISQMDLAHELDLSTKNENIIPELITFL